MPQIGRYEIERELGRGAMGVVYLGYDPLLDRRVAIKTILPDSATQDQPWDALLKRLIREAKAAAALNHPSIVAVHDIVETVGMFSVVMEFVEGKSLAEASPLGTCAPLDFSAKILRGCAAALDHAHSRGVVHRDVKLANIMLDQAGTAKIADFGIAKILGSATDLTHGFALGTLEYMSPEQLNAQPVDGRTDQYSLAVVAYRLLTGCKIYDSETIASWCGMILTQAPIPATKRNAALPPAVDAVLAKALAKKPEDRFSSCVQFVDELGVALAGLPVPPVYAPLNALPDTSSDAPMLLQTPPARYGKLWVGAAVAAVAAGVLFMLTRSGNANPGAKAENPPIALDGVTPTTVMGRVPPTPKTVPAPKTESPSKVAPVPKAETNGAIIPETANLPVKGTVANIIGNERPAEAPRILRNPKDGLNYVRIPHGTFAMGCSPGDTSCSSIEKPVHQVTLSKDIWIGETEVTQEAYEKVMGKNPSFFKGPHLPVESVAWSEADAYCETIGAHLPTEAEWELAARGGRPETLYDDIGAIAWYSENSGMRTHDVATKRANAYGLYDVYGNVWEWLADWFSPSPYPSQDLIDPGGPTSGILRGLRGASFNVIPPRIRASARGGALPGRRERIFGFRCASENPLGTSSVSSLKPPTGKDEGRPPDAPVANQVWQNPADHLNYVWISPGRFLMGCSIGDNECSDSEKPAHEVTLSKGFWIGQTEVTQQAYLLVLRRNPSRTKGTYLPVDSVNWTDALQYCEAIGMRLPTEAQWEYAARGGTPAASYGQLDAIAWYTANSAQMAHPIAQKQPNAYRLYDMLGNVREWVSDWSDGKYYERREERDPAGPSDGTQHVQRGGAWPGAVRNLRVSTRFLTPDLPTTGFRCERE